MAEVKDEGEDTSGRIPRLLAAINQNQCTPHHSSYSLRFLSKTRNLPSFFDCHACGNRVIFKKGKFNDLQTLYSQWRVVLLCKECLRNVENANICSYCFKKISSNEEALVCRDCSRRVHHSCISMHHREFVSVSVFGSFTCVDCWVPKFRVKSNANSTKIVSSSSCSGTKSRALVLRNCKASFDDMVKHANLSAEEAIAVASRAKEKARRKAEMAERATELAKNALDLARVVAIEEGQGRHSPQRSGLNDEQLALQLHRAMNSSQRISKKRLLNLDCVVDLEKQHCDGELLRSREDDLDSVSVCGKLEVCTDDKIFENPDTLYAEPSVRVGALDSDSFVDLDGKEITHEEPNEELGLMERCGGSDKVLLKESYKGDRLDMPVKEEQASCSNIIINSSGDDNSVSSKFECSPKQNGSKLKLSPNCTALNSSSADEKNGSQEPDRYLMKYSKRNPDQSGSGDGKIGSQESGRYLMKYSKTDPDRYLIKYSKRNSSLKAGLDRKSMSTSQDFQLKSCTSACILPYWQQNCSKASRTLSDASYQSTSVQLQTSASATGPSKCQS